MTSDCQFREVQHWPRLIGWPLVIVGWASVAIFALSQVNSGLQIVVAVVLAIICIPLSCLLLEWMGPTVEVNHGALSYSIWPFYRKEIALENVTTCTAKRFHPPGNDVRWKRIGSTVPDTHYVEVRLHDGTVVDITTEHPSRLLDAVKQGMAMSHSYQEESTSVSQ